MRVVTTINRPTVLSEFWRITSGSQYCEVVGDGRCVSDGYGNYGNNEYCEVEALKPLIVTTEQYDIENGHDFVAVEGTVYKYRGRGPDNIFMQAGDKWRWKSDSGFQRSGFRICGNGGTFVCMLDSPW